MKFKSFEIRSLNDTQDLLLEYRFELVKWADDHSRCWRIAVLEFNKRDNTFKIESVDLRLLEYREEGLEEWLIKWSELKKIEYLYERE